LATSHVEVIVRDSKSPRQASDMRDGDAPTTARRGTFNLVAHTSMYAIVHYSKGIVQDRTKPVMSNGWRTRRAWHPQKNLDHDQRHLGMPGPRHYILRADSRAPSDPRTVPIFLVMYMTLLSGAVWPRRIFNHGLGTTIPTGRAARSATAERRCQSSQPNPEFRMPRHHQHPHQQHEATPLANQTELMRRE